MKFKLYKELLNKSDIMSHVFLNCTYPELSESIAKGNDGLSDNEIENREIDITLLIEGKEVDANKFFNELWAQYAEHVEKDAINLIKEKTSNKFNDIQYKIHQLEEICEDLAKDINWNAKNPFVNP